MKRISEEEAAELQADFIVEHTMWLRTTEDGVEIHLGLAPDDGTRCVICGTPITKRHDVGWTHDVGLKQRGGCTIVFPPYQSEVSE